MTFKKIVVALDRSFQSSFVFARALEQAKRHVSQLLIVHTISVQATGQSRSALDLRRGSATSDMYATLRGMQQQRIQQEIHKAQEWLQPYLEQSTEKGIATQIDSRVGEPGVQICTVAEQWHADLIVVGRREHRGLKEAALGSVSDYVIRHAPCSVLIVEPIVAQQPKSPTNFTQRVDTLEASPFHF